MYLRTIKAKGGDGVEFEYIRLVEAYWENGYSKQRVVANLGRKDILAPHLESLVQLLGGGKKTKANSLSCGEPIEATVAACWGPMLVARSLWQPPRTMVTEVAGEEPGGRVFVVQSEERLAYERAMREAAMEKTRQAVDKLAVRVAAGRLK